MHFVPYVGVFFGRWALQWLPCRIPKCWLALELVPTRWQRPPLPANIARPPARNLSCTFSPQLDLQSHAAHIRLSAQHEQLQLDLNPPAFTSLARHRSHNLCWPRTPSHRNILSTTASRISSWAAVANRNFSFDFSHHALQSFLYVSNPTTDSSDAN